jgi:hypothetical protein
LFVLDNVRNEDANIAFFFDNCEGIDTFREKNNVNDDGESQRNNTPRWKIMQFFEKSLGHVTNIYYICTSCKAAGDDNGIK